MSAEPAPDLDPTIANYYHQAPEEHRLEQGAFALWLADAGYTVHLVDPVLRLVAEAERRSADRPRPLASCRVGDARALDFPAQSADIVLLLGPLYHLTEAVDRARRRGGY